MKGINQVILFGLMGHDPELSTTAGGLARCELRFATNRRVKRNDEWIDVTEWHRVTLWERQAELAAKVLRKGSPVGIEGELRTESWTDAEGKARSKLVVHARNLSLVPSRRKGDEAPAAGLPPTHPAFSEGESPLSEEIPF